MALRGRGPAQRIGAALSQADLQAILAHLNEDSEELLAGTSAGRPVVAVRVRASVGRPGGSAQARWRQLRATEWAAWTRTLPWRAAASLGIGTAGGLLGMLIQPRMGLLLGGLAAIVAGWALRFRPSPDAIAWRRGAAGVRRPAALLKLLERHGWAVLHDLAVPGSAANIDHLVIGPGGVFVVDSKQYRGRLQLGPTGRLWHGHYPLAPVLRAVSFEADPSVRAASSIRSAAPARTSSFALPQCSGVARLTAIDSAAPPLDGGAAGLGIFRTAEHR
ncbi:MAG TPA: nuclease-related domain-containing protein [Actinomycetota bacterium]|nr:nuclease-related domain-containing protein [Actinomycetota bacterium]